MLPDATSGSGTLRLLECLAPGTHVAERWQVGPAVRTEVVLIRAKMVWYFRLTSSLDHLPLEVTRDRGKSLDFLLQTDDKVLHALAVSADLQLGLLVRLSLQLFQCSCLSILLSLSLFSLRLVQALW